MKNIEKYLRALQKIRGFKAEEVLREKVLKINEFFRAEGLDSAVVGISGGIDSALVLALLSEASKQHDSPIKKILALVMPIFGNGTTDQLEATKKASNYINGIYNPKIQEEIMDLTLAYKHYLIPNASAFANGQLASIVRTPMLYYSAALLQDDGFKSIVVGTTNRDEGAFIGFFGKASDGMVDLQPIADLHKSEVYAISELLNIPKYIMDATPKGDVFDGRVDEEMIGAPYWILEAVQLEIQFTNNFPVFISQYESYLGDFTQVEWDYWNKCKSNIYQIRAKNLHKYKVGSPARYIDVLDRIVI